MKTCDPTGRPSRLALALIAGSLVAGATNASLAADLDVEAVSRQLDVMKGIVRTTLATSPEVSGTRLASSPSSIPVDAYYLKGQGAVLIVSLPRSARFGLLGSAPYGPDKMASELDAVRADLLARESVEAELLAAQQARVEAAAAMMAAEAAGAESAQRSAEAAQALDQLAAQLKQQQQQSENVKKQLEARLAEEKLRAEDRRRQAQLMAEQAEKRRGESAAKVAQLVESLTGEVLEMLAGHGDSIGVVSPDERVVVILRAGGSSSLFPSRKQRGIQARIVSVTKADVTSLKSGKLSRGAFESRALVYDN